MIFGHIRTQKTTSPINLKQGVFWVFIENTVKFGRDYHQCVEESLVFFL